MGLEERQSSLENEMHTAKDTIWRLTNRVVHLEKEVKNFKMLLQSSTVSNKLTKRSATATISKSAKLAEIARRKQKLKEWRTSAAIASTSKCSNDSIIEEVIVKEEAISDTSDVSLMSDYENCDPHFPDLNPSDSDLRSTREHPTKTEVEDSDSESDADYEGNSSGTPGRHRSKIWRHFHTKSMKPTASGRERILAICKHCKKQVSPKSDRLRNHIKKCLSSPKSATVDVSWSTLDRNLDATIEDLEASYLMDMDNDSNHALDDATINKALAQSTSNAENNVGRKKGPVWKHYATVTTVKSNGQIRIHAICKKCKKEVSPKSDRLRNHIIKCNIPKIDCPAINNPNQQPQTQPGISNPAGTVSEQQDNKMNISQTSIAPDQSELVNVIPNDAVQQNDPPGPISGTEQEVFNTLAGKLDTGNEVPVSLTPKVGIKKGPVWQHFSTNTIQTTEGHTRILVICNYCKKEVSPKSDRLKKHIEKGHGIPIPVPTL